MTTPSAFRTSFAYDVLVNWFPGHMVKATKTIVDKLKACDLVIEVRDARIPFSSANPKLDAAVHEKNRLVLLNKADLANHNLQRRVLAQFEARGVPAFFCSTTTGKNVSDIIPYAVQTARRLQRSPSASITMMVVGYPNVGKSSLINALARRAGHHPGAKTGPLPGVTRAVHAIRVSEAPAVFLLDTPGVMVPRVDSAETGLRLALTGAVKDERVGIDVLADFLLYSLNRVGCFQYVAAFGLRAPCDDYGQVLAAVQRKLGGASAHKAQQYMLQLYRSGALGTATLDDVP